MARQSPPPAYSPGLGTTPKCFPGRPIRTGEAPRGESSTTGHMEEMIPMETGEEGRIQFGPQPDTIPETHMAPESGEQPPLKEGVCRFRRWLPSIRGRLIS